MSIVLFPHCDLHLALTGAQTLTLRMFDRIVDPANPKRIKLDPIPRASCTFDFFAPHSTPGQRFNDLPAVDAAGVVTATHLGIYLFQLRRGTEYIVGRLQVHSTIEAWWFGNDSITTALDPAAAHSQPSIYARFKDEPTGTDLIGDITGHGYVTLVSADPSKVAVTPEGRLQGLQETGTSVDITGTFLGPPQKLPARVVDYGKRRRELAPVQAPRVSQAQNTHNIVFVAEGFRAADKPAFESIVTNTTRELFDKPRHQPYGMLEHNFNVFKVFVPSQDNAVTCGFRVTDTAVAGLTPAGAPIPYEDSVSTGTNMYIMSELVSKVGLPKRGESRSHTAIKTDWIGQGLPNFDPARVDETLINAWKVHRSDGILQARDTYFGMQLGSRLADRTSGVSDPPVLPPADSPGAPLQAFIGRVYEFYQAPLVTRLLTPDPRRHPPELNSGASAENIVLQFVSGLEYTQSPFPHIGPEWVPDPARLKPSRGLVGLIANEGFYGGANFGNNTGTSVTMAKGERVPFTYDAARQLMKRDPPAVTPDLANVVNVISHEFGHSFNLADEYEEFAGDGKSTADAVDSTSDNVAELGFIKGTTGREVDVSKVKWAGLHRIRVSARLLVDSQTAPGGIKVTIDQREIGKWVKAKADSAKVHLRNRVIQPSGQQLPLGPAPADYLPNLTIGDIDQARGTMILGVASPPPTPFVAGSLVYVPKVENNQPVLVVEAKVRTFLNGTRLPLNVDPEFTNPKRQGADSPKDISGFKPPCSSARLIGLFEGAARFAGGHYRPTGTCKMRSADAPDEGGEFCYICKWLIVNRVDPSYHAFLSEKFYPEAKKNG